MLLRKSNREDIPHPKIRAAKNKRNGKGRKEGQVVGAWDRTRRAENSISLREKRRLLAT
jgi:hypothetical protein